MFATTFTAEISDFFLGTEIDEIISGTLTLGKTGVVVETIRTTEICDPVYIFICATALGDGLYGLIGSLDSSFSS